jgi:hypothetical protein
MTEPTESVPRKLGAFFAPLRLLRGVVEKALIFWTFLKAPFRYLLVEDRQGSFAGNRPATRQPRTASLDYASC